MRRDIRRGGILQAAALRVSSNQSSYRTISAVSSCCSSEQRLPPSAACCSKLSSTELRMLPAAGLPGVRQVLQSLSDIPARPLHICH
eukprot:447704-Hanusia_phi.AAC.3